MSRARKWAGPVLAIAVWVGLALLTGSMCWFQEVFGLPCPGCGTMHAARELLAGNVREALRWHPLIIITFTALPAVVAGAYLCRGKPSSRIWNAAAIALAVLYGGVFIARMICYFPHTQPMVPLPTSLWRLVLGLLAS